MSDVAAGTITRAEVIRDGEHVHLVFTCASDYAAMLFADHLCDDMVAGKLRLELDCEPHQASRP